MVYDKKPYVLQSVKKERVEQFKINICRQGGSYNNDMTVQVRYSEESGEPLLTIQDPANQEISLVEAKAILKLLEQRQPGKKKTKKKQH